MSELRYDEIKGPPSTQTDFVNFSRLGSNFGSNYNHEITISFAPEIPGNSRMNHRLVEASPNELPPQRVVPDNKLATAKSFERN